MIVLKRLIYLAGIIESYAIEKTIHLDIHSDLKRVQNDYIVPISLIFNEMILNSLKHGFLDLQDGHI